MQIRPFPNILFRTPYFPFNYNSVKHIISSKIFAEALFFASPDLYQEKEKISQEVKNKKKLISLNKYASRSMTRPTPFGLFAGCSLASIGDITNIYLSKQEKYRSNTRLDMDYICALVLYLEKNELIRKQLIYYPNESIYKLGDKLRYTEFKYKANKRVHTLSSIDKNEYVEHILHKSLAGATIKDIAESIIDDDITVEDATEFIIELIDNQLLRSELQIGVTGQDPLLNLQNHLQNLEGAENIKNAVSSILELLKQINTSFIGTRIESYNEVIEHIKKIGIEYNPRYIFQTDLYKPVEYAHISNNTIKNITEVLLLLNKSANKLKKYNLSKFQTAFYDRYENRKVPLSEALDTELGLGYPIGLNEKSISPLVGDIILPNNNVSGGDIVLNKWNQLLLKKYIEIYTNKESWLNLSDDDFLNLATNKAEFSSTFSCICEMINENDVYLKGVSEHATKLLARFCHLDENIESHVKSITEMEQQLNSDVVYAEVVHLPQPRIGNILLRPILRKYEITYLAKAGTDNEYVIPISDLMISIEKGRLVLTSEKLNKEIIPCLSSAHNYRNESMPIYHFLCDMQHQKTQGGFSFSWGNLSPLFDYLPRVIYKNCILSRARWIIRKKQIQEWVRLSEKELVSAISCYREEKGIPDKIIISEFDNELFINFTDQLSIETFLSIGKKKEYLEIEEFLFDEKNAVVKSEEGVFTNEFIISFYTTSKD